MELVGLPSLDLFYHLVVIELIQQTKMSDQEPDNSHPLPPTKAGRTVILAVDSSRHSERQAGL